MMIRLKEHIDKGFVLNTAVSWQAIFNDWGLILELVLVGLHLPPGVTFEYETDTLGNFVLYR